MKTSLKLDSEVELGKVLLLARVVLVDGLTEAEGDMGLANGPGRCDEKKCDGRRTL